MEEENGKVFTTSRGTEMVAWWLQKQDAAAPKVIFTIHIGASGDGSEIDKKQYDWIQLSVEDRKADLKECGDMVIEYAKNKKWSNNYYLYIATADLYGDCQVLYDYEADKIWIPNAEPIYKEMYEKFKTFNAKDLAETQEGIDFLLDNQLGYIKHNEIEYNLISSYDVYIHDGEFTSYNREESTAY
jgi:hypothetical protein